MGTLQDLLAPKLGLIFFHTLIFVVLVFVLKRYAWHFLLDVITQEEVQYAKAQKEMKTAERKLNQLETSAERVITQAKARSERMLANAVATKKAMLEEAKEEIAHEKRVMLEKAAQAIAQKEEVARQKVKKEAASLIVNIAQKFLAKELQKSDAQLHLLHTLIAATTIEEHGISG